MNVTDRAGRPPLSPQEGWLRDGQQVLHFKPLRYDRWSQALEVTLGVKRSRCVLSVVSIQHLHHLNAEAGAVSEEHGEVGHGAQGWQLDGG